MLDAIKSSFPQSAVTPKKDGKNVAGAEDSEQKLK